MEKEWGGTIYTLYSIDWEWQTGKERDKVEVNQDYHKEGSKTDTSHEGKATKVKQEIS